MYPIKEIHISYAAKILQAKLTRPTTIDITICQQLVCDIEHSFDKHCGRFIGCFAQRSDKSLCFYLCGKSDPEGNLDHLFVFYFNEEFPEIQDEDVEQLKPVIPNISRENPSLKISIINSRCEAHPARYLSALLHSINSVIDVRLIDDFKSRLYFDYDIRDIPIEPSSTNIVCPENKTATSKLSSLAKQHGKAIALVRDIESDTAPGKPPSKAEALMFRSRGHIIGALTDKRLNLAVFILSHPGQFQDFSQYSHIKSLIKFGLSAGSIFLSTRIESLIGLEPIPCSGRINYYAWELMYSLMPHSLTNINLNELIYIYGSDDQLVSQALASHMEKRSSHPPSSASNSQKSSQSRLSQSSSNFDSQATIIVDHTTIRDELSFWRDVSAKRRRIRDSIVPPIHGMKPFNDLTQGYLKLLPSYDEAVRLMVQIWSNWVPSFASFRLIYATSDLESSPMKLARFLIHPFMTPRNEPALIIVDKHYEEWVYLNPTNEDHKDQGRFYTIIANHVRTILPEFREYGCRVLAMTSYFHQEYPKVHLLMALYVISRLFPYFKALPEKIIYGEWELRKYASDICTELQYVNASHNIAHCLFDLEGRLLAGAYQSLPSPLQYQVSVVPKDQCMFCKKRGFKNLGRHMSADHGGQAASANFKRRLNWDS